MVRAFLLLLVIFDVARAEIVVPQPTVEATQGAPVTLTLNQAIELGIRNATMVLKSETNRKITGADLLAAYGKFLPNLGFSASYGYTTGKSFSGGSAGVADASYRSATYQLSSIINIFDGFGDISNLNAAANRDKASGLTVERAKQQISIDVTQAFLQVYLDNRVVEIDEQNFRVSQEREKLIRGRHSVGSANDADLYRQVADTAQDQTTLIDSRARAHVDMLRLLQRIRIDARENHVIEPPDVPELAQAIGLPAESSLIEDALRDRRDYKSQLNVTNAAADDVTTAQKTYWPTLDVGATFGGVGRTYSELSLPGVATTLTPSDSLFSQLGQQNQFTIGLNLNWAIFDRFMTTDAVQRAMAERDNARIDLDDLQKQVVVDVRAGYSDYTAARDQARTTLVQQTAAQEAFRVINGRYRVGASSFLDLTTSQAQVVSAQQTHAQALVSLKLRRAALLFYVGRDPASSDF